MSNVLCLRQNFCDSDFFAGFSYSSQKSAMPASNVLDGERRSKVWRSAGFFEVTEYNKGIVFQESPGVNITANIAEGEYVTDALFLAAVKLALDTAGGTPVYTVTREASSFKLKITSSLAGGAVFRLMCTDPDFTSTALLGYSPAADLTGAAFYIADSAKIHTSEWLKWDLGSSALPTAFIAIGLRQAAIKLSEYATIILRGNHTDEWTSPAYLEFLTYNETALALFNAEGFAACRYWKLEIVDHSNPNGYIELSNVYLGAHAEVEQGAVRFPLRTTKVDLGEKTISRGGITVSDEIGMTAEHDFQWALLTTAEKELLETFTEKLGSTKRFFVWLDPNGVFSTAPESKALYVTFNEPASYSLESPNVWSSDWSIREEV